MPIFSDTQQKVLNEFKASPSNMQTFFLEDEYIKKVCACWSFITREVTPIKGKPPEEENERWAWLWSAVKVNVFELAYVTGVKDKCITALAVARANRLIYPDGTLNTFVIQMLTPTIEDEIVSARIKTTATEKKPSGPWKPRPNKPEGKASIKNKKEPLIKPMNL